MSVFSNARQKISNQSAEVKAEIEGRLDILSDLGHLKLDEMKRELLNDLKQVQESNFPPAGFALKEDSGLRVISTSGLDAEISKELESVFVGKDDAWNKLGTTVLTKSISSLLGVGQGSTQTKHSYFAFLDGLKTETEDNRVPVRIDVRLWCYNFSIEGIQALASSVIAYTYRKSLIDLSKVQTRYHIESFMRALNAPKELTSDMIRLVEMSKDNNDKNMANITAFSDLAIGSEKQALKNILL